MVEARMKQEGDREAADIDSIRLHLRAQYRGILTDDDVEHHLDASIGLAAARNPHFPQCGRMTPTCRIDQGPMVSRWRLS